MTNNTYKKIIVILNIIYIFTIFATTHYFTHRYDYPKSKTTMTVTEFLYDKNSNHWRELYYDGEKNVAYRNMVIVKDNDHTPLNKNNAETTEEIKIDMAASGTTEPRKGCDPSDPINGLFGCYMDFPED